MPPRTRRLHEPASGGSPQTTGRSEGPDQRSIGRKWEFGRISAFVGNQGRGVSSYGKAAGFEACFAKLISFEVDDAQKDSACIAGRKCPIAEGRQARTMRAWRKNDNLHDWKD